MFPGAERTCCLMDFNAAFIDWQGNSNRYYYYYYSALVDMGGEVNASGGRVVGGWVDIVENWRGSVSLTLFKLLNKRREKDIRRSCCKIYI